MVKTPERIWIDSKGMYPYFYPKEPSDSAFPVTEYIRADLCHPTPAPCVELETVATQVRLIGDDYFRPFKPLLGEKLVEETRELVTRQYAKGVIAAEREEKLEAAWLEAEGIISDLKADNKRLREALESIADWPNGGKNYGQENIERLARAVLEEVKL